MEEFYLGTHRLPHIDISEIPLFISHRVLKERKKKPFNPRSPVAIDSGGFSELSLYGEWRTTPSEYIETLTRMEGLNLKIDWAASQDWMVEDIMLSKTGKTILEHQELTVRNFIELYDSETGFEFVPTIQGQTLEQYRHHVGMYRERGFDLKRLNRVGVGSVCRRESTREIEFIMSNLANDGLSIHGFGVKSGGMKRYAQHLKSADSLAWSFNARVRKEYCQVHQENHTTKNCANCFHYAVEWFNRCIEPHLSFDCECINTDMGGKCTDCLRSVA
jgi:hypothetical protein